ncbi:MAG TPA: hypothetical protein VGD35_04355, partial [Chitinophaga sp.]
KKIILKSLQKLLISIMAGTVLAGIIHLSAYYYGPVIVCIEIGPGSVNLSETYKNLQAAGDIDTADNRIILLLY